MDLVLDGLVTILSVAVVAQYIWATRGHFVSDGMSRGALLLGISVLLSTVIYSLLVWTLPQPAWASVVGLLIELASLALFWAAISASRQARLRFAFAPEHPHSVLTAGPYRYLRHPFYTSYVMFWAGWTVAAWSIWGLVVLLLLVAFYVAAALGEEQKFARGPLSEQYEAYKRSAGFFWPRLLPGATDR